jgi:hypothetical protein
MTLSRQGLLVAKLAIVIFIVYWPRLAILAEVLIEWLFTPNTLIILGFN